MIEKYFENDNLILINDIDDSLFLFYNKTEDVSKALSYDTWYFTEDELLKEILEISSEEDVFEFMESEFEKYNNTEIEELEIKTCFDSFITENNLQEAYKKWKNNKGDE